MRTHEAKGLSGFNVKAFHHVQLGVMIYSQLRTCYVRTRKSKRLWDKTE